MANPHRGRKKDAKNKAKEDPEGQNLDQEGVNVFQVTSDPNEELQR